MIIRISLAYEFLLFLNADSANSVVSLRTDCALIFMPFDAVLEVAFSIHVFIEVWAFAAALALSVFLAAFNHTGPSLKFVVRDAFGAHALGVLKAAICHFFAGFAVVEIVPAFAWCAAEIVVRTAIVNRALIVVEFEGLIACTARVVILLVFTAQQIVMFALVQD